MHDGLAWGLWRIPEAESRWLGPVRGRRVLELGCGAARWSIGLRKRGAHAVGIDQSLGQLAKGRSQARSSRVQLPLVRGNAERLPFRDRSFDIVFCDWGALTFGDSRQCVPECARVLRTGGLLVFATGSAFGLVGWDAKADRLTRRLRRPYFGPMQRTVGDCIEFRPTTGEWIDLFSRNGLVVERMSETRAPPRSSSRYISTGDAKWARSWPVESIWRVRKK
jgi:ubiquinone/menaquinone biosynthesis C-methylase UbiE